MEHEDNPIEKPGRGGGNWASLIRATGSPLRMFALLVLICSSVFGIAAASSYGEEIFIYTLHTFLALAGSFALIALWSPRSFYSPSELAALLELEQRMGHDKPILPEARPLIPTLAAAAVIVIYAVYQYFT